MKQTCHYPEHKGDRGFDDADGLYTMTESDGPPFLDAGERPADSRSVPVCRVCGETYGRDDSRIAKV